ncbi:MAG: DUF4177 domain-containing protein [Atopobiaceae bacterium]|nr:DUF4177 domain-containing protein [Atopobiaceae bacterium]
MSFSDKHEDEPSFSKTSGENYHYVVLQVTLREKFLGNGTNNLYELEQVINEQAQKGYRLHTITTSGSFDLVSSQRIHATMVFERIV